MHLSVVNLKSLAEFVILNEVKDLLFNTSDGKCTHIYGANFRLSTPVPEATRILTFPYIPKRNNRSCCSV